MGPLNESERRAFCDLARAELPRLFGLARKLSAEDPEDLVQECLLRAFRAFPGLRDAASGGAWLRRILVNVVRDRGRRKSRAPAEVSLDDPEDFSLYRAIAEEDPFPYSDSVHLDVLGCFGEDDVRAVLLRLPLLYRAPLVLRYIEGCDTKETASLLGAPLGTVLARLHRGRKLFEREMWRYALERGLLESEPARSGGGRS